MMRLEYFAFLLLLYFSPFSDGSFGDLKSPIMIPNVTEIIIQEGDTLNLTCKGTNQIRFSYPELAENTSVVTSSIQHTEDGIIHTANLLQLQVSAFYTDYYGCAYADTPIDREVHNQSNVVWIYVYVTSTLNRFANERTDDFKVLVIGADAILPCRPTSPDYPVTLFEDITREILLSKKVTFDPKIGYTIRDVGLADSGFYKCIIDFHDGTESQSYDYFLSVIQWAERLPMPYITFYPRHVVEGHDLQLNCSIQVESSHFGYNINWTTPQSQSSDNWANSDRTTSLMYFSRTNDYIEMTNILTIKNVNYNDAGVYTCLCTTRSESAQAVQTITIYNPNDRFINLIPQNSKVIYEANYNQNVSFNVSLDAYPEVKVKWLDHRGDEIVNDKKFQILANDTYIQLLIKEVKIHDIGQYTLLAYNKFQMATLNFTLGVSTFPVLDFLTKLDNYYMPNTNIKIECHAAGFPVPNITWHFIELELNENHQQRLLTTVHNELETPKIKSVVSFNLNSTGKVKCTACNRLGCDEIEETIFLSDVPEGLKILKPSNITEGDDINLICAASIYNYTDTIKWYNEDRKLISETDRIAIKMHRTQFTHRSILSIKNIQKLDGKSPYVCVGSRKDGTFVFEEETLFINSAKIPQFIDVNMNGSKNVYDLETASQSIVSFKCFIQGMPIPVISWFKDQQPLNEHDNAYKVYNNSQVLKIIRPTGKHSGTYLCRAHNRLGSIEAFHTIIIKGEELSSGLVIGMIIVSIICAILLIYCSIKVKREKKIRKQLMEAGLTHFEEGALECLNPDLTVDDQADLLPYDKQWEFSREKLKFGKQLGCGEFGVVMKAEAYGICESEPVTTVAVKMVRETTKPTYIRALASELKILIHLGKHLNVVNILGACTKNIAKGELMVIVEYCRYGNLQNYLMRHRVDFVNQIDIKTGQIDPTIGQLLLTKSMSMGNHNRIKYAALSFSRSNSTNSNDATEQARLTIHNAQNDSTMPETLTTNSNTIQPGWRSNYLGDYKDQNLKPICTQDLLAWAFQVARGMEYLSQRKVLHGDLAARNILLSEDNIVKICDFGLAKTMYNDNNYQKKGDAPLPIKWMAIESIRDRIFSTQSDVWSFGIVLWEFFTLGETPYPGLEAEKQYQKLSEGYRMEKPDLATDHVYDIMLKCWETKPAKRPTFMDLAENIGNLLEDSIKKHYMELNIPYMNMNTLALESGTNDYLTMMSAPDHEALSSPCDYINSPNVPLSSATDCSYICMSPSSETDQSEIFSPKNSLESTHFKFPSLDVKRQSAADFHPTGAESRPMLSGDVEDPYLKPINVQERRAEFAKNNNRHKSSRNSSELHEHKPEYCNALSNREIIHPYNTEVKDNSDFTKLTDKSFNKYKNFTPPIINAQDNYLNMPKNHFIKENPDGFTNPSYTIINNPGINRPGE